MTHTKAKRIGRVKGKTRARMAKKLTRSREFYAHRSANRMIEGIRAKLRFRRGSGDFTVPDWAKGMTLDTLVSDFIKLGKNTMMEKVLMNVDCSTGAARWGDGTLAP